MDRALIDTDIFVDTLTLNTQSAIIAGRIYGDLERTGQPIGRVRDLGYSLKLDNWR